MRYDLWAELPSPLKLDFRREFYQYSAGVYRDCETILSAYIPAKMGGEMPAEDYLASFSKEDLPDCYLTMSYGECSGKKFISELLESGRYNAPEVLGYFPQVMVVDLAKLNNRPIPKSFEQLSDEIYKNEICIIGSQDMPDPTAALYLYRSKGKSAMKRFISNLAGFAAPVQTIRHIGRASNSFGSIFIMPVLFALLCLGKRNVQLIIPSEGVIAEPIIYMTAQDAKNRNLMHRFLLSDKVRELFEKKYMVSTQNEYIKISEICKNRIIDSELDYVFECHKN